LLLDLTCRGPGLIGSQDGGHCLGGESLAELVKLITGAREPRLL
jgi:hypothetical protein